MRATDGELEGESQVEEGNLGAILQALVRQQSFTFLEFLEEQAVASVKSAIKQVVVGVIEPKQEGTLTNLMAEYAEVAASEAWTNLLDMLVGALVVVERDHHDQIPAPALSPQVERQVVHGSAAHENLKSSIPVPWGHGVSCCPVAACLLCSVATPPRQPHQRRGLPDQSERACLVLAVVPPAATKSVLPSCLME